MLDQLATAHVTHRVRAQDEAGDQAAGATNALTATTELQQAAALLDAVHDRVDAAMAASGRIAWHPEPTETPTVSRWVSVVFLQGQDADEVLAIIDRDGTDAAIEHLTGFDMGDETTQAAFVNGYVYDTIPTGPLDRTTTNGEYTLTYNHDHGHVSLLRRQPESQELEAPASKTTPARQGARRQARVVEDDDDPFAPSQSSSMSRGRAL